MKILLTGASGFLGEVMQTEWNNDHEIITLGRSEKAMIVCDLSNQLPDIPSIEMVVHAAGKAHIFPGSAEEKDDFFRVNVQGTKNLLVALEQNQQLKKFVFISSVSVYGLVEGIDIREDSSLLATDPYGKSKIEAEKSVLDWCTKRKIDYYILRVPLIAGKNAPGNLGAMVKGIKSGRYVSIGKAKSKKSIVLADDLAKFISTIEGPSGIYNLTDGYHPSFQELEHAIADFYKKKNPVSLPGIAAKVLGLVGDMIGAKFPVNSNKLKKITSTLTFNDTKAKTYLQWKPRKVLKGWEIG